MWPSFFNFSADAIAFCNSVLTLFGGATRILCEVELPADAYTLNLGRTIQVTDDRYGLSGGKVVVIVSIDDDTDQEQSTVQAIG